MKSFILCTSLLLSSADFAIAQTYSTETGKAIFHSEVPLHTFSGTSEHLTGMIDLETGIVDFYIDLATLDTGIGKRDRDMRQTLETDKYPFAEFYGTLTSNFDTTLTEEQKAVAEGKFKIHGVEREIEVKGTLQLTDEGLLLKANWILLLKDYEIEPPSLLFVKVDQEQKIEIEALLKPQNN